MRESTSHEQKSRREQIRDTVIRRLGALEARVFTFSICGRMGWSSAATALQSLNVSRI
jgi:hypothetical protein